MKETLNASKITTIEQNLFRLTSPEFHHMSRFGILSGKTFIEKENPEELAQRFENQSKLFSKILTIIPEEAKTQHVYIISHLLAEHSLYRLTSVLKKSPAKIDKNWKKRDYYEYLKKRHHYLREKDTSYAEIVKSWLEKASFNNVKILKQCPIIKIPDQNLKQSYFIFDKDYPFFYKDTFFPANSPLRNDNYCYDSDNNCYQHIKKIASRSLFLPLEDFYSSVLKLFNS